LWYRARFLQEGTMSRKPLVNPVALREARQALINAAPLVSEYTGVEEVAVSLTFADPEGKQQPSPRGVSFAPHMHAYFQFACPMRDCTGGGFDANAELQRALSRGRTGHTGSMECHGNRPRSGLKTLRCNIRVHYTLAIKAAERARARG
jgi:hypothetical protein